MFWWFFESGIIKIKGFNVSVGLIDMIWVNFFIYGGVDIIFIFYGVNGGDS